MYFYRPPALVTTVFERYDQLLPRLAAHETLWLFNPGLELPAEAGPLAPECVPAIRTLPAWVTHIDFNGWLERAHPWTLFKCRRGGA